MLKTQIAEDVWEMLIEWSPLNESEFSPSLEDRIDNDYYIADEDLDDKIRDLLKNKGYLKFQTEESVKIATPAELIDYLFTVITENQVRS